VLFQSFWDGDHIGLKIGLKIGIKVGIKYDGPL
jgi:hypothetical protein